MPLYALLQIPLLLNSILRRLLLDIFVTRYHVKCIWNSCEISCLYRQLSLSPFLNLTQFNYSEGVGEQNQCLDAWQLPNASLILDRCGHFHICCI